MVEDREEYMTEDPVLFLRNFVRDLIPCSYRNFRWFFLVALLYQVLVGCLTLHRVLKCGTEYRICIVGLMLQITGMICLFSSIYIEFQMDQAGKIFHRYCNSLDSPSRKISPTVSNYKRKMKKLCFVQAVAIVSINLTSYPLNDEEKTFLCTKWILEEYFGSYHGLFFLTTTFSNLVNGLAVLNVLCFCLYIHLQMRFQFLLIHEQVDSLERFGKKGGHDDVIFQSLVFRRITYFVKQHNKLRELKGVLVSPFEKLAAIGVPLSAESVVVTALYLLATHASTAILSRGTIGVFVTLSVIGLMFFTGQYLIDESERLHRSICDLPWENWNKKNREALLIILPNTAKPIKMTCYGLYELSCASILSVVKLGYSLLTIVVQFK